MLGVLKQRQKMKFGYQTGKVDIFYQKVTKKLLLKTELFAKK